MKNLIADVPRLSWYAGTVGVIALLICVIGGAANHAAFFQGWVISWIFLLNVSLASMMLLMIHELTGGDWGYLLRPALMAAMMLLPFVALMAIPLAWGLTQLFPWALANAHGETVPANPGYLNACDFLIRNALWLLIWSLFAGVMFARLRGAYGRKTPQRRRFVIVGLLSYLLIITVFAFDWIGSPIPKWSSSTIGLRLGAGQFIAAFAFSAPFAIRRMKGVPVEKGRQDLKDFGNLLLTFSMFWAYIAFMQYLTVWGEDQPHEIAWYWPRVQTSWRVLAPPLIMLNFLLPAAALLFRSIKTNGFRLQIVCYIALAGQWFDTLWLLAPSWRQQGFEIRWLDICALLAEGGLWLSLFASIMVRVGWSSQPIHK